MLMAARPRLTVSTKDGDKSLLLILLASYGADHPETEDLLAKMRES